MSLRGTSEYANSMTSCRQTCPMSFMIHLILMWSMQMREVMLRQCTILQVINCTYLRGSPTIIYWHSSSQVYTSLYPTSNWPTPPIKTMVYRQARSSSQWSMEVGPKVYWEQQMASDSSLYLMYDCTQTSSSVSLEGSDREQTSNSLWLKSWQLPSVYLTRQKGSLSFILCSSICWISYFLFLCRMYLRKCDLFSLKICVPLPSWKQGGTNLSKYLMCMNSGSICSSIFSLKVYSKMFLYYLRRRTAVGYMERRDTLLVSFMSLPSLRLVWKIQRLSPSRKMMSGR